MRVAVKICGLTTPEAVTAAVQGGAAYVGMVFFPRSPRAVTAEEAAALLAPVPPLVQRVGLFVNPDDALLAATLATAPLDMLQLHGDESPERVAAIRRTFGLPVMKALAVGQPDDPARAHPYVPVVDRLLFDARPPAGSDRPGGNAVAFDWRLLQGLSWSVPWMLAGGLTPETVAQAVALSGAREVDVSSGVETEGRKDPARIDAFLAVAARL